MDSVVAAVVTSAVVVTTATLHRAWMPWPALKRPIIEVLETLSLWQLAWTAAVICTSPSRQLMEH